MKIELKTCRLCGGIANMFAYKGADIFIPIEDIKDENKASQFSVKCGSCFCGTGVYTSINRAVEVWNGRQE